MTCLVPQSEAELVDMIRAADTPMAIRGGGTRSPMADGPVLSLAGLTGVTLYEPGALTLVVKPGTSVAEVEATLAEKNQRLAFEPMDHRVILGTVGEPTMGGVVGLNVSGPRRVQAGAARDYLLGAVFVDGRGARIRNGGRVMKNVTGYDLARLHCGARGTLGVLTELSFKVLPMPETVATLAVSAETPGQAVDVMAQALGSPFDVTGAAWDGRRVFLRIEGFAQSVRYRAHALSDRIPGLAQIDADPWPAIRDGGPINDIDRDIWRVSLRASQGGVMADRLQKAGAKVMLDWGGALVWAATTPGTDLRGQMVGPGGHATRLRGDGMSPARHPDPAPVAAIAAGLRHQFDPRGLFAEQS